MVFGWITADSAERARWLVLTDEQGMVRGHATVVSTSYPEHAGAAAPGARPWVGFIDGFEATRSYAVQAILTDDRHACRVAAWP
jgi:hypothetical protein